MISLLGVGLMVERPATAQVDGDTYTNPTYGYRLQWDADVWTVPADGTGDLTLETDAVQLNLRSGQFYSGNAATCRNDLVSRLPDDPSVISSEPYSGAGELDGESDGRAFATLRVELSAQGGQDAGTVVERIDCRTVVAGEAVLAITWTAPVDGYSDAAVLTDQLLGGLVIPSLQAPGSTVAGITGNAYASPDYGFMIGWDDDTWFPFSPVDALFGLNDETSLITFDLPDIYAGNPARCVEATLSDLGSSPGLLGATPIEIDGQEVAGLDDTGWSYAAVNADYGGAERFVEVRCAAIPGETVTIRAVHSGPIASYEAEASLAAPVFASLSIAGSHREKDIGAAGATPTSDGTPEGPAPATPSAETGTPAPQTRASTPQATPAEPAETGLIAFTAAGGGWSIAFDPSIWTPMDPAIYATADFAVAGESSVVTFDTVQSNGARPQDILEGVVVVDILAAGGANGVQRLDDPPTGPGAGGVGEAYAYPSPGGNTFAEAVVVLPLDDGSVVVVRVYTIPERYAGGLQALDGLLSGFLGQPSS